jgi:hypothetical protein
LPVAQGLARQFLCSHERLPEAGTVGANAVRLAPHFAPPPRQENAIAVCDYCGLEADVTITSSNRHTYTYPELECRFLQEQASKPSGLQMFHKAECPHLVKAVEEEVAELRADD